MLDNAPAKTTEACVGNRIDLTMVPLESLSPLTRSLLGNLLNQRRIFTSEDGYSRDWRGLFELVGIPKSYYPLVKDHDNPTCYLLELWNSKSEQCKRGANLAELQNVLGCIDRWDILDDTSKMFEQDAEQYLVKEQQRATKKAQTAELQESRELTDIDIITKDDTLDHKQQYDAFILFAQEDMEFASKMVDRLEARGLNLCLKDRDILGGGTFEHQVISTLISERCRRVVVIISEAFLASPLNDFMVTFAQALQIEKKQRKVIPCVYGKCELPPHLRYTCRLDYQRSQNLYNFWDKLAASIRVTPRAAAGVEMSVASGEAMQKPLHSLTNGRSFAVTAPLPISPKVVERDESTLVVKLPTATEHEGGSSSLKKSHSFWDLFSGISQKRDKLNGSTSQLHINEISPSSSPKKAASSPLGFIRRNKQQPYAVAAASSVPSTSTLATMAVKEEKPSKPKKKWYKPIGRKVATAM
uniref:TIR domain-containing protein n=1 Tax=Anopheles atroparvus TaxID=41427 RepID=A0A182IZK0_ANOAO